MNDTIASRWRRRLGQAALLIGLGLAAIGANAGRAEAAMAVPAPIATPAASSAIQPIYWARDRYGRRVWVEQRYRRPPPRQYYRHDRYDRRYRHHQPPRRNGWVDRRGNWHPYR